MEKAMKLFLMLLALIPMAASAQVTHSPCAPFEDRDGVFAEMLEESIHPVKGPLHMWVCWRIVEGQWKPTSIYCRESTWAELGVGGLSNLGARAEAIRKAADPLAAWAAADKRYVKRASPRCDEAIKAFKGVK
jgi:hypothetical protein